MTVGGAVGLPWWIFWPTALGGAITGLTLLWKFGIRPVGGALWAAVKAAPQIADELGQVRDILSANIVQRLAQLEQQAERIPRVQQQVDENWVATVQLTDKFDQYVEVAAEREKAAAVERELQIAERTRVNPRLEE